VTSAKRKAHATTATARLADDSRGEVPPSPFFWNSSLRLGPAAADEPESVSNGTGSPDSPSPRAGHLGKLDG